MQEFEKIFKSFTVTAVSVILITALAAAGVTAAMKGQYNITGEKPEQVGFFSESEKSFQSLESLFEKIL